MKYKYWLICLLTIFVISSCCNKNISAKEKNSKIELNTAFKKVYQAVQEAIAESKDTSFQLETIDLTFATTSTIEGEAGAKLYVLTGKYSRSKSTSKKTTFSFGRDESAAKAFIKDPKIEEFKSYIKTMIIATQELNRIENFTLKEIEIEVSFSIKSSVSGEFEIELIPITPTASLSKEKEIEHTVSIKFKKK